MSSSINADITFTDTRDAISLLPIVGNEYVKLNIGTPDVTKKGTINFTKHPFVVYKILRKMDIQQGSSLTLKLTTKEIFFNLRRRVSQSYSGGYSEMVDKIFNKKDNTKIYLLAPIVRGRKGEYKKEIQSYKRRGYFNKKWTNRKYITTNQEHIL